MSKEYYFRLTTSSELEEGIRCSDSHVYWTCEGITNIPLKKTKKNNKNISTVYNYNSTVPTLFLPGMKPTALNLATWHRDFATDCANMIE